MVETHISLSVNRLLNEDTYAIPLYQRNFAWTYDEIEQLLNDVADAFQEKRDNYYIGTLVVNEENDLFKIIDGQQRTTALNLIALALKHEFGFDRLKAVNLTFPARRKSNENIQKLFINEKISEDDENELTRGYRHAKDALKKVLGERQLEPQPFVDYLFNKVIIFRSILPKDLDLNLYFERFNSRGEQLEAHEILKAQMMAKFGIDQEMAQKFARIWDACAEFDKPVASQFKMRRKRADNFQERERIFGWHFSNYSFHNIYDDIDFYQNEPTEIGGVLTIDSATDGYVSYQLNDFIATDHVEKIMGKTGKINKYIGLFLKTAIDKSKLGKYSYGYKFSQKRIIRQKIKLPIDNNGNEIRSLSARFTLPELFSKYMKDDFKKAMYMKEKIFSKIVFIAYLDKTNPTLCTLTFDKSTTLLNPW